MKSFQVMLILILSFQYLFGQPNTYYIQDAERHIQEQNYATAHLLLEDAIRKHGFLPEFINPMIDNVLKNHYMHRDFKTFYLQDYLPNKETEHLDSVEPVVVASYNPEQILKKLLTINSAYAWSYKLLGDFYFKKMNNSERFDESGYLTFLSLKESVFENYRRSVQLGYHDVHVNRWLGNFYLQLKHQTLARQYYLKNTENDATDPQSYAQLAKIYLAEKKYNEAYVFATIALRQPADLTPFLQYEATRVAAISLRNLDETNRFLDYIFDCIRIFPDAQQAYLDLINYYQSAKNLARIEKFFRQMLLNNPFDEKGFHHLEKHAVKHGAYQFGENLFEDLMARYEHFDEAMGNIYRFRGNLLFHQGFVEDAKKSWEISRQYYSRFLPENSPLLKELGKANPTSAVSKSY